MPNSPLLRNRLFLAAMTVLLLPSSVPAQTTVWGLQRNDRFSVETVIERETTVQLGEGPQSVSTSRDSLVFEYIVVDILRGGDIAVQVRVTRADRDPDGQSGAAGNSLARQLALLRNLKVTLVIDADGVVKSVPDYRESLSRLADANQSGRQLASDSIPEEVVATWFGHPFWMTLPQGKRENGTRWERIHQTSLGQLGALRTVATCAVDSVEDAAMTGITVSGDSRYLTPDSADDDTADLLNFVGAKAAMESFSGTGSIIVTDNSEDDEQPVTEKKRPQFEKLSLEFSCSGTATVRSGGTETTLRFQQQQKQSSRLLPGYRIGRQPDLRIFNQPQR